MQQRLVTRVVSPRRKSTTGSIDVIVHGLGCPRRGKRVPVKGYCQKCGQASRNLGSEVIFQNKKVYILK